MSAAPSGSAVRPSELLPGFSWVVPDRLAASGQPARGRPLHEVEAYVELWSLGVRAVLSLLEIPPPVGVIEEAGLKSLHFPVRDLRAPSDVAGFARVVDEMNELIKGGMPVLVHCYAGIGRTGMCLATWFARHGGLTPQQAAREVRRLRPMSIETAGQMAVVNALSRPL